MSLQINAGSPMSQQIIPVHGGYRKLLSYQKSEVIFDGTMFFTSRYFKRGDRTIDQMVQAARSGKQNIAEASMASATSKEMEIKLTNVARASLFELLEDHRDFLRTRGLQEWDKDHPYATRLRELNLICPVSYETFRRGIEHTDPAISANVLIGLINVTTFLLHRQVNRLEQQFLKEGGLRERMTRARLASRTKS